MNNRRQKREKLLVKRFPDFKLGAEDAFRHDDFFFFFFFLDTQFQLKVQLRIFQLNFESSEADNFESAFSPSLCKGGIAEIRVSPLMPLGLRFN